MKVEAKLSSSLLQTSKSGARSSVKQQACLLLLLFFVAGGMMSKAAAADQNSLAAIRKLAAQPSITEPEYVGGMTAVIKSAVADYLNSPKGKRDPSGQYEIVDDIVAEAVKLKPPWACDVVKAGIQAVTPLNGAPEPRVVAALVAEVVQYVQTTNPELLESIITCATADAPEAARAILNAVAGILTNSVGGTVNRLNVTLPNGVATPTPTPAPTPVPQVTPVAPI